MNHAPLPAGQPIPLDDLQRIDDICGQFESDWRAGQAPAIDQCLRDSDEAIRPYLFRELLAIEAELRGLREGRDFAPYYQRFPQYRAILDEFVGIPKAPASTAIQGITRELTTSSGEDEAPVDIPRPGPELPKQLGEFELVRELGRGGMGVVYLAKHTTLNRLVALKVLNESGNRRSDHLARFRAEAKTVARLQHPNIVQIYGTHTFRDRPCLVLEYVRGVNLADRLRGEPQDVHESAQLVETVARAVHVVNAKGIIHRDLKPANILLEGEVRWSLSRYTPKITDFGLSKDHSGEFERDVQTRSSVIVGTPSYMTPEQVRGGTLAPSSDVYAMGVILYEMLTGQPPFQGDSTMTTLQMIAYQEPPSPRRLRPDCPRDLETICLKCLEKEPSRRYPNGLALAMDLQRFRDGHPVLARPVGTLGRAWRWSRRNPLPAALGLAVAVSLLLGTGIASFFAVRAADQAEQAQDERDEARRQKANAVHAAELEKQAMKDASLKLYASRVCWSQREFERDMPDKARMVLDLAQPEYRGWEYDYLRHTGPRAPTIYANATGAALGFSPSSQIASLHQDGTLNLWLSPDAKPDNPSGTWPHPVEVAAFAPGGRFLAVGNPTGTVEVWETVRRRRLGMVSSHGVVPTAVAVSQDGQHLAIASNRFVQVVEVISGREVLTYEPSDPVNALAFSPDGRGLGVALKGKVAFEVIDTTTGKPRASFTPEASGLGHMAEVRAIAFSPDGQRLISGGADGMVKIWHAERGADLLTLELPGQKVVGLAFSPNGQRIAAATEDGNVRVWHASPTSKGSEYP